MKTNFGKLAGPMLALASLAVLAGCGNVSRNVAKDGKSAGELVWPAVDHASSLHAGGTAPTLDSVRSIHAGMTKNQIAALVGYPHFQEGVFGVREWNYVFNFYKQGSDAAAVCQYKVLFDDHGLAQSFYWKLASCAELLKPAAKSEPQDEHYSLSADALFPFDKSSVDDITPEGRHQLDELAGKIESHGKRAGMVHVVGYTDRLGRDDYNDRLSRKRAYAVMEYLSRHGVPTGSITAEGRGSLAPVSTDCHQGKRSELIACLAPDRRVEVIVNGWQ